MTGENKKRFEEWLNDGRWFCNTPFKLNLRSFERLPHEMQKGVIEAYYDSVGLHIGVDYYEDVFYSKVGGAFFYDNPSPTRKEATLAAFEEADKLINKTL